MAINKVYDELQLDVEFTQASTRENLVSKENISISFGKISKYFADLHSQAFTGYTHPTYTARTGKPAGNQTPGFGATFTISQITSDGTGHVTAATDRTVKIPNTTMGAATADAAGSIGLVPAPAAGKQTSFLRGDGTWVVPTNTNTTYTLSGAYGSSSNTWVTTLTPSSGNATTSTVPTASTSVYGITKLSSATNSTSTALAATPSAVKSAYDLANGKSTVSFSASLTSGTKVGTITIDGTATDIYCSTVNNAALTLKGAGTTVTTFTANASSAKSLDIVAGSNVTVTADATNAKISIASSHPTITKSTDTTSTASPAHGGTFTTVDSVTRDGNGHVTKINTKTVTLPADSNTDTLVSQTLATADHNRPLLMSYYLTGETTTTAQVVHRNDALYFNPSSGVLRSPRLYLQTTDMPITINLDVLQPTAGENVNVLAVRYKSTDGVNTHAVYPIGILGNDATGSSATYNSGVRLGSTNGTTIVGAGESSVNFAAAQAKYNDETLYLVADQAVYMYTNCSNDATTVTGPWRVGGFTTGASAITSGRVMITDGTTGGFKASDYTIAKSVPSDAEFTDTTYSAGTGLSLSGTTFNHSNSVTAVTSAVFKKITYDAQGHITGTANVVASDIPSLDYSKVSISRNLTSGTKVGTITIDGTATDLYCQTNTNTTYTLSGAYGSSSNTWVTTLTPSSGTATTSTVPTASTSVYGITKLSSATNSTSTTLAATPSAVKDAYDLANGKSTVSFSASLTTGTKIGTITINGTGTDIYCETNTNTDTKVTDTVGTANTYYPAGGTSTSTATGTQVFDTSFKFIGTTGTTSAVGEATLVLGNSTASGTANNKQGSIVLYGSTAYQHIIQGAPTAIRTLTLPNKTGTVAVTSDIPTVNDATLTLKGEGTTVTTFSANSSSDASLDIVAGSNVTITPDATNSKITIAAKDTVTTVTASGSGNAVTAITASNGALTVTKGSTFSLSTHTHTVSNITDFPTLSSAATQTGTVGSAGLPVYLNSGTITACSIPASGAWWNTSTPRVPQIYTNGVMEIGRYVDFHNTAATTNNYDIRLDCGSTSILTVQSNSGSTRLNISGTLPSLTFQQTTSGATYNNTNCGILAHPGDTTGLGMTFQSGGLMVIGSGESAVNMYNRLISSTTDSADNNRNPYLVSGYINSSNVFTGATEVTCISSDMYILFQVAVPTASAVPTDWGDDNLKTVALDSNGSFKPTITHKGSLGDSSYYWNSAYIDSLHLSTARLYTENSGYIDLVPSSSTSAPSNTITIPGVTATMAVSRKAHIYDDSSDATSYPWHKFAEVTITSANYDYVATFLVSPGFNISSTSVPRKTGMLTMHIRTGATKIFGNGQFKWLFAGDQIDPTNFVMMYTNTANTSCKVELWYKQSYQYEAYTFNAIDEHARTIKEIYTMTLYDQSGHGVATLPSATDTIPSTLGCIKNAPGIYPVKGTQTATTASWTGNIAVSELYDGLTIAYYLPHTSASSVTLNLTLADGTTTGAIPCYYNNESRIGTQYGAGSTVVLTYWSAATSGLSTDRWTRCDYATTNANQTNTTTNANYRVLFSTNANDTTQSGTTRKNINLKYNPSTATLKIGDYVSGSSDTKNGHLVFGNNSNIYTHTINTNVDKLSDVSLTLNSTDGIMGTDTLCYKGYESANLASDTVPGTLADISSLSNTVSFSGYLARFSYFTVLLCVGTDVSARTTVQVSAVNGYQSYQLIWGGAPTQSGGNLSITSGLVNITESSGTITLNFGKCASYWQFSAASSTPTRGTTPDIHVLKVYGHSIRSQGYH